jgi:hypothetical protein
MGFASEWLGSGALFPRLINEAPVNDTGIIVVVPSYDEPGITKLLDSLIECSRPGCSAEVIVVVNAPAKAGRTSLKNNELTISKIKSWERDKKPFFRLFVIDAGQPQIKGWGVGMARKTGMDEALRRFDIIGRSDGIIANTDADCTVRDDYFTALESDFLLKKGRKGCSIFFEHPLEGEEYNAEVYKSVRQYELHLRYFCQALIFAGYPNSFQTVGSSLGVRAIDYMKAGGMNRRQAGEDFYFIQKLVAAGGFFNLNTTTVYPSPRVSGRVPFGTGAAVGKMVAAGENAFLTYSLQAFIDLKAFFQLCESAVRSDEKELHLLYKKLPHPLRSFILQDEWCGRIAEINNNTSSVEAFRKRFYDWFNMFRVVKYLNYTHQGLFTKVPVSDASYEFIKLAFSVGFEGNEIEMIRYLRERERIL